MANLFDDRSKQFLYNFFKNNANAQGDINKSINDANNLYNNLITKYSNSSEIPDNELTPIINQVNSFKNTKNKYSNIVNLGISQLNNIIKIIDTISGIITVSSVIIKILTALPIPARFLTSGIIVKFSNTVQKTDRKIESLNNTIDNTKPFLSILLNLLNTLKTLLLVLDQIIGLIEAFLASKNQNYQNYLNSSLSDNVTNYQDLSGLNNIINSNIIGYYKGFKFELREENNIQYQIGNIKRKYAVAINTKGIEVLKSDYSFASHPQVLIDELKQVIDFNNLQG